MAKKQTRINRSDLKIYPSERLSDHDDGGGMPLGTPIKGVANELFNPISSIARVNGAFYARLVYLGVLRSDAEPLIGSFSAITRPPKDPTTSYLLFKATKFGEQRNEILKRIEAYSVGTIESRMTLLSTQSKYSKIVQAYQRVGEPLPVVGDVYCLRQDKAGYPSHEQYIQVIDVKAEDRTFTNPQNQRDFVRTVIKLEISSKLEADFIGAEYPSENYVDTPCKIRETHVADAAQYYGVKPLAQAIQKQTQQIKITSLMEKIVPTNQVETPLIDLTAAGNIQTLFDGSKKGDEGLVSLAVSQNYYKASIQNQIYSIYLGQLPQMGSIKVHSSRGIITDKNAKLQLSDDFYGNVDYQQGIITLKPSETIFINKIEFRPATSDLKVADTTKIDISINNRSYNYVTALNPVPAVGSLQISYRAQGVWYTLRDDGTGALRGVSASHGSGSISYITGTINLSLGELPDIDSSILFAWGTKATYFNRSGSQPTAKLRFSLSADAHPASIKLAWNHNGSKSARCDAAGKITGDWTGYYDAATRQIYIDTGANFDHPKGVLDVKVTYNTGERTFLEIKAPLRNHEGQVTVNLGEKPITPNTFQLRFNLLIENYNPITQEIRLVDPYKVLKDDGRGKLIDETGVEMGSINYTERTATFNPETTIQIPKSKYHWVPIAENTRRYFFDSYEYIPAGASMPIDESGLVEVWFFESDSSTATTESLKSELVEVDLLPSFAETIMPGSLHFTWGDQAYFDRLGVLYTKLDPSTGAAQVAGEIDYKAGKAVLKNWHWTDGSDPKIQSLTTGMQTNPVDAVTFRTPSAPIRPGSLQVRAVATDGTQITATAELDGTIKGKEIGGRVDAQYGVVDIQFGSFVEAEGQEGEDWYQIEAVQDGKIFKPKHVLAETITYNTVAYSYLPVDSTVVKIDTVRLPQDGRIPIFRRGDTILISNSVKEDIGSAHTGGQTVQLSRQDVDRICVADANGKVVDANLWDYDLDAGSITWTTLLDLSDYQMPLFVTHTQEERNRILKADIDGTLSLIFPTKRDYPTDGTYVSSLLIGGDLQVRASVPFTQRSWDHTWRDEVVGEQTLNKLNVKDYPIMLTDDGAITERWAIKWLSSNQFELYGETLGFVLKTDTLQDLAPINPATQKPYFIIPKQAFGNDAPWQVQNIIRFNTWGTLLPVWVLCAVQPSSTHPVGEDGFNLCIFGDTTEI